MALSSKPYQEWEKEDVEELINEPRAEEGIRLDFKFDYPRLRSPDKDERVKGALSILKDVSAMANSAGGALIVGVRQLGQEHAAGNISPIENSDRLERTISNLVQTGLDIRPAALRFRHISYDNGKAVVIVLIPQNTSSLSMITYKDCNQFWVRKGRDNFPMSRTEIHYKVEQMNKIRESARDELEEIHSHLLLKSRLMEKVVWFAAVPIERQRDHISVDIQELREVISNSSYFKKYLDRSQNIYGSWTPGKYVGNLDSLEPYLYGVRLARRSEKRALLEIRRDGVLVFGVRYLGEDTTIRVGRVYEIWESSLYLLKDIQDHYGVGRLAVVQVGLLSMGDHKLRGPKDSVGDEIDGHKLDNDDIRLDAIMLDENWEPRTTFVEYAKILGHAGGYEKLLKYPPWIE